jgi:hypothetical protein
VYRCVVIKGIYFLTVKNFCQRYKIFECWPGFGVGLFAERRIQCMAQGPHGEGEAGLAATSHHHVPQVGAHAALPAATQRHAPQHTSHIATHPASHTWHKPFLCSRIAPFSGQHPVCMHACCMDHFPSAPLLSVCRTTFPSSSVAWLTHHFS